MEQELLIQEELLHELNKKPRRPLSTITLFCGNRGLMHQRFLSKYVGKRTLRKWTRKTLDVHINDQELNYEFVGLLFPKWRIKETTQS